MQIGDFDNLLENDEADHIDLEFYIGHPFIDEVRALELDIAEIDVQREKAKGAQKAKLQRAIDDRQGRIDELNAMASASIANIRVTKLPGMVYAGLMVGMPATLEEVERSSLSYSLDGVFTEAVKQSLSLLDGETALLLTPEQVQKLLGKLSGSEVSALRSAVIALNDFGPKLEVEAAKKALPSSATISTRPEGSASASDASTAGSPESATS